MKKPFPILIIFLGLAIGPCLAQSYLAPRPFYIGLGASYPLGCVITGGGYNQSGWGGTISFNGLWSSPTNAPLDYSGGGLLFSSSKVYDFTLLASIRVLKEWPSASKYLNFGVEAGPSLVHTSIADNFQDVRGWHLFSSNYTFDRVHDNSIGISLRGKLEWRLVDWGGLELGGNANFNEVKPYYGVDLIWTFGEYKE